MEFLKNVKLKAGVAFREWKEKRQEKQAQSAEPAGVTIPLSLVRSAKLAAWMAYFSLVYFLWLYTLDIARDRAASLHLTHVGGWIGDVQFYFPYIVGFAIVAIGIPYVAKIAIPTFMSLSWRGNFWPKLWALFIAMAVSLVVIAGTFTVQGDTILERDRDSAVAVEQVQIAAATLNAQIGDVQHAMDERTQSPSAYVRTAASMSPDAYDRFVAARQGDPQYQRLLSYRAVSEEMVALNQQMSALRAQQAQSTAVASVQGVVTTERTGWIADTLGWLEGARAMLLSFVMDIVCLIMPWIALRLEQARNRQMGVEASGWAPAGLRIEDLRDEEAVKPQPMKPAREVVTDAETGEELIKITPKPHWRKQKGKKQRVETTPEPLPDETGFQDTARSGVTLGGVMESVGEPLTPTVAPTAGVAEGETEQAVHEATNDDDNPPAQPDLQSDDEAALALQELELTSSTEDAQVETQQQEAEDAASGESGEQPEHHETSDREEPETREDRMLPSSVAAE